MDYDVFDGVGHEPMLPLKTVSYRASRDHKSNKKMAPLSLNCSSLL